MESGRGKGNEATDAAHKAGGAAPVAAASGSSGQVDAGGAAGAEAALAARGRLVVETAKFLESVPDIRAEKVERIQSALEASAYQVAGEKVADRIVSEAVREVACRNR